MPVPTKAFSSVGCAMRTRTVEQLGDVTGNPETRAHIYVYIYVVNESKVECYVVNELEVS